MAKPTKNQKTNSNEDITRKRMLEILGAYFDENGGFPQNLPKDIANEILRISKLTGKEQQKALRQFEDKYPSKQVESDRWAEKINKDYKKNLNSGKDNISGSELGKSFEKLKTKLFYDTAKEKSAQKEFEQTARLTQELQTSLNTFINNAITEYKKQYPDMDEDIAVKDYQQRFANKINEIMNDANSLKDLKQKLTTYLETIKQVTTQLKTMTPKEDKTMTEENKEENKSEPEYNEVLNNWAKSKGIDLEKLSDDNKKAAQAYFDKHGNLNDFETQVIEKDDNNNQSSAEKENKEGNETPTPSESSNQNNEDKETDKEPVVFKVNETKEEHTPLSKNLNAIRDHWEKWCQETKDEKEQPLRNFKEIPNEDGFLKFEIEPTEALKAQNPDAKGAEVTYYSETEATMPMTDYAYFHQMAKAAKDVSGIEVIECGNIKTPGYATRLIAAAYANGLEVEKAPNKLDLQPETIKDIPDDVMIKVLDKQIFNRDSNIAEKIDYDSIKDALSVYKDIQERAKDENGNPKGTMKNLDISKMRFTDEAAKNQTIAAALELNLKINNNGKPVDFDLEQIREISEKAAHNFETQQKLEEIKNKKQKNEEKRANIEAEAQTGQNAEPVKGSQKGQENSGAEQQTSTGNDNAAQLRAQQNKNRDR